ncbi:hypothetical protein ES703_63397 [subsurface metagenome]
MPFDVEPAAPNLFFKILFKIEPLCQLKTTHSQICKKIDPHLFKAVDEQQFPQGFIVQP